LIFGNLNSLTLHKKSAGHLLDFIFKKCTIELHDFNSKQFLFCVLFYKLTKDQLLFA